MSWRGGGGRALRKRLLRVASMAAQQVQVFNIVQRQDRGGVLRQAACSFCIPMQTESGEISLCGRGDAVFFRAQGPCPLCDAILFRRQELITRTGVDASAEGKSFSQV